MKILLVGEYSRFHNSLQEGLRALGHQVTLVACGDSFKKLPADILLDTKFTNSSFWKLIRSICYKISGIDLTALVLYIRFLKIKKRLLGYDYVQLINECPLPIPPLFQKKILRFFFSQYSNVFVVACGDDFWFISYLLSQKFPFSTLTPFLKDSSLKKKYRYTLNRIDKSHQKLHHFVLAHIRGVIPASVEYAIPYQNHPKSLPMIPNAIQLDEIQYIQPFPKSENSDSGQKINILHGINQKNYEKKGNIFFEQALNYIQNRYSDSVHIEVIYDLPYPIYAEKIKKCHILLDQVFAHDQGYNALEAMAMGKVVFTGAGIYFQKHYRLEYPVAIATSPNTQQIIKDLERLILTPKLILEIGKNARNFIEKHHHYKDIAQRYLDTWSTNCDSN